MEPFPPTQMANRSKQAKKGPKGLKIPKMAPHPTFQKYIFQKKFSSTQRANPYFFLYGVQGDPKNNLAESERPENRQNRPHKTLETAKMGLGGAEKGPFGPFSAFPRPGKVRTIPERVPEGFPRVGKASRRVWKAFEGIWGHFGVIWGGACHLDW